MCATNFLQCSLICLILTHWKYLSPTAMLFLKMGLTESHSVNSEPDNM